MNNIEKKETKGKIMELVNDMLPEIEKKVDSILDNNNIEQGTDSKWGLAKTILSAVLYSMAEQFEPPKSLKELRKIFRNLKIIA